MKLLLTVLVVSALFLLVGLCLLSAQERTPPALTETQRLTIQNLTQAIELDQLHAQAAAASFEKHRGEFLALIGRLQVAGYSLDIQTLTYSPIPEAAVTPEVPK